MCPRAEEHIVHARLEVALVDDLLEILGHGPSDVGVGQVEQERVDVLALQPMSLRSLLASRTSAPLFYTGIDLTPSQTEPSNAGPSKSGPSPASTNPLAHAARGLLPGDQLAATQEALPAALEVTTV